MAEVRTRQYVYSSISNTSEEGASSLDFGLTSPETEVSIAIIQDPIR